MPLIVAIERCNASSEAISGSEAFVILTHFRGTQGREVLFTQDANEDLLEQINSSLDFVTRRLGRSFSIRGRQRTETIEIPFIAMRESIINAIVHSDYSIRAPIKVAIYDDRVEVFSPGIFPGPLDPLRLDQGITYIRNIVITKVMREARFIEKLGTGFINIFESYRRAKLKTPSVIEGENFIKVILPRLPLDISEDSPSASEEAVINMLHEQGSITAQDVERRLGISRASTTRILRSLAGAGVIQKKGAGKATRYHLA